MDIYGAREKQEDFPGITSDIIIDNLNDGAHINMSDSDELLKYDNAVIIFMSANDVMENGEVLGEFYKTDYTPIVYDRIKSYGIDDLKDIFE